MQYKVLLSSLCALSVFLGGCKFSNPLMPHGKYLSSSLDKSYEKVTTRRVEARHCRFYAPVTFHASFDKAFENAMLLSPEGTTGLADVEMTYTNTAYIPIPFLSFGKTCAIISGIPARR